MKTIFPTATGCNGTFLVGQRRHPSAVTAQQVGVVVLKRQYHIHGQTLVPVDDPVGIRMIDELNPPTHGGENDFVTEFESDMAPYKPYVDLVVRHHYSTGDTCRVSVEPPLGIERLWFLRAGAAPGMPDRDAGHHMFGWENRALEERRLLAIDTGDNPPPNAPVFSNHYFNGYRRRFLQGAIPPATVAPGSIIRISRQTGSHTTTLALTLGQEQMRAHVFVADGRSPDKQRFWCRRGIPALRADTLVISPQTEEAYVVWRGIWPYDLYPADRYRMLEVSLTEGN